MRSERSPTSLPQDYYDEFFKITKNDTTSGPGKLAGRTGVVTSGHFAGVYVKLDKTPREKIEKTELVLLDSGSTAVEMP